MTNIIKSNAEYKQWLTDLKLRIRQSQLKAAVKVNTELIELYWSMGKDIVEKQKKAEWGDGFIEQLSKDLREEFPNIQGFSLTNLKYIRRWYLFYNKDIEKTQKVNSLLTKYHGDIISELYQNVNQ